MLNFFVAGPDLVRWELTTVGHSGQCRLTIRHSQGTIVEYFDNVTSALLRQNELEALLVEARSGVKSSEEPWVDVDVPLKKSKQPARGE